MVSAPIYISLKVFVITILTFCIKVLVFLRFVEKIKEIYEKICGYAILSYTELEIKVSQYDSIDSCESVR